MIAEGKKEQLKSFEQVNNDQLRWLYQLWVLILVLIKEAQAQTFLRLRR